MERCILTCLLLFNAVFGSAQHYTAEDSIYVYNHFVSYDKDDGTINLVDLPSLEEFHDSVPNIAKHYFHKALYMDGLPIEHRVAMADYLSVEQRKEGLLRMYAQFKKKEKEDLALFFWCLTYHQIPYSELGISQEEVDKYCPYCKDWFWQPPS